MNINDLMEAFRQPDARHRTMPQWSWNGRLSEERITEQLEQFAEQGAGGLFPHARPGLITGYLSDEWFRMWRHGVREAERLGMQFHIYDEFTCPAGHAGGHVVARRPHLVQQVLGVSVVADPAAGPDGEVLGWYHWDRREGSVSEASAEDVESASSEEPLLALVVCSGRHRPAKGGFALPDVLRRETAETFIETTHARYAEYGAEHFGETVRFVFCDEPQIFGSGDAWPYSRHLVREFRKDHGYELDDHLGQLCFGLPGAARVRFDYWWTVNRLFNQNFMRTLHDWCEQNDLMLTGHVMEHSWPSPRMHPDAMASLRWMQAPGDDLLGFQFSATRPSENAISLLNLKELGSVAGQLGRRWIVTESCGGAGYQASFGVFKPLEDYLLAFGINVMDPHLSHQSLSGRRKYDWPHTLSDHSPWWSHYRRHADHVARANTALDAGRERNRVLVLHPTTSAWLHYAPDPFPSPEDGDPLGELEASQTDLLLKLYGAQVDFDLGDEFIMEEFARVEQERLRVGERSYELVVVPPAMENWTAATLLLMRDYLEAGGRVASAGSPPACVDGRAADEPAELRGEYGEQWTTTEDPASLVDAVRRLVPPRIARPDGGSLPDGLCWRRVELEGGGVLYFFCNPWAEGLRTRVQLEREHVAHLRTDSGDAVALDAASENGGAVAGLELPPRGHALWLCTPEPLEAVRPAETPGETPVGLEAERVDGPPDNVLVIDYCDLEAEGRRCEDMNTIHADRVNWRLQGFEQNPWGRAHQFRRTVIDRPVPEDSGFSVTYRFAVDPDLDGRRRATLRIGVERPWLYRITLNGEPVGQEEAEPWFDEHARALPVGEQVQDGQNELTLTAEPFHVLCEIMPVYLIGEFALRPAERGFRVVPPEPLGLGEWSEQGLPFYPGGVSYRYGFEVSQPCRRLRCRLRDWQGSVAVVRVDGDERGVIYPYEDSLDLHGEFTAGRHELTLEVIGNMRSLMGPHHAEGLAGSWTWARSPDAQPPGESYILPAVGLMEDPELSVLTD
ncbi:MAG: glycosyl hydrolase [Planctomycetota bacterium]